MTINVFTPRTKKPELFSDMKKDLALSPVSDDITVLKNEDAVKESIKNLMFMDRGEKLMRPNFGGGIRELLFENLTPDVITQLENRITETIELYEPRCELINVNAQASLDENSVKVTINFYVSNVELPTQLDLILERIR
mgnify:CR=1 FL=1